MNKDFITLTAEEEALIEKMNQKYPEMNFDLQAVSPARSGEVRKFMLSHIEDADAQRAALLSGGNWAGARLMNAALRDALLDWFMAEFDRMGLRYPFMAREANASFVDRRFAESNYETIHNQRDEAQALLDKALALNEERKKATSYLLQSIEDLRMDMMMNRHSSQESLEKIDDIVKAMVSNGLAQLPQKKTDKKLAQLSEQEILDKMGEREERQAEKALDETKKMVQDALVDLRDFVPDERKRCQLLADVGLYSRHTELFDRVIIPLYEKGDFIYPRRSSARLAKALYPFVQFQNLLNIASFAKFLRESFYEYDQQKKKALNK